ncbi:MAG: archaeosine synthase subunit alpha [Methanothrix sp.]|nr:archaeosine synthase subunit alpha [Methanothrix sp.]MDD4447725.1 archaeosine synthase subunit alpha [Methanothrix sp.]
MTKYFETVRRDGPARMGKLLTEPQISTPALISKDDYVSAGSIYSYASLQDAINAAEALREQKKLAILPYVPAALRSEPALELPPLDLTGPKGVMVHPFSSIEPEIADVYVLGSSGALKNPRDLVAAIVSVREKIAPDTALYAPAIATPANLGLLVYLGIDLLDSTRVLADGLLGRYHTRDGVWKAAELTELPCRCESCRKMAAGERKAELLIAHNLQKLEEELLAVREAIRSETMREYVERQVRVTPEQTTALRLLDQEHQYLEKRTPQIRRSTFYANCSESLQRVEVTRFAERVIKRYKAPESDVLLLLPCSAKKPYSFSRSHRLFAEAVGGHRRYLHELILTSPLALVPRELEEAYPAASYDVPVTGRWDREERAWLTSCLQAYLKKNRYDRIVAHLDGELEEAVKESGLEATFTGGGTKGPDLDRLSAAVAEACHAAKRLPDLRLLRYRAHADYYFGEGAGDLLLQGKIIVKGREIQDEKKRPLAATTPSGMIALSLSGAALLEPLGRYIVKIGDFLPKGSLLAPGVVDADEQIRPGDEVIIVGEKAFGVGRAKMSGWEMKASRRGVAVEIRHIKGRQ